MRALQERLTDGTPLVADGAMGTQLHARGIPLETCFDEVNVTHPEVVTEIHRSYISAGADLLETNTFSANRYKLAEYGLEDQVQAINRAGATLARRAADTAERPVYVAGSVGPLGLGIQPFGRLKAEDAEVAFAEQMQALAAAGVDALVMETFTDLAEMQVALRAAAAVAPHLPVIALMTFTSDDRTPSGDLPGKVARELLNAGAEVIGVNCSGGPAQISRILQAMRSAAPDGIFAAMPNAGFPHTVGGRMMYPATTGYFADYALTFRALGATVIGGCCGTTPDHISAMHHALDEVQAGTRALPLLQVLDTLNGEDGSDPAEGQRPTELARRLAEGLFTVSVEMKPPRSYNPGRMIDAARLLQEAGANLINVPDSPAARMRMSPWAVSHLLQTQLGMETILHFPTRGRNLLRIQGDLLGAHALGLRNVFVVMGDPTKIGDYPDASDNFDIAPSSLMQLISQRLNAGVDGAGNSIGQPTAFTVGCALNMAADDLDKEIDLTVKKLKAGANFALGQAVFEPARVERFHQRFEAVTGDPFTLPVLMGVMPLYSLKHALFLNNEVPGIIIPDSILERLDRVGDKAAQTGVKVAQELLRDMRGLIQGAYIIPAFGHYNLAAEVIEAVETA